MHPENQGGTPVFFNIRVTLKTLFGYLKGGHTVDELIDDFPSVKRQQALALLDFIQSNFMFNSFSDVQTAGWRKHPQKTKIPFWR